MYTSQRSENKIRLCHKTHPPSPTRLPMQPNLTQADLNRIILRIKKCTMQRSKSASGFKSAGMRPYHSEKQEEGRQKTYAPAGKKERGKAGTHGFTPVRGLNPQMYLHTHAGSLSSSEPEGGDWKGTRAHSPLCFLSSVSRSLQL